MEKLLIILIIILYSCQVHEEKKQDIKLLDTQKQDIYMRLQKKQRSLENKNSESADRLIKLLENKGEKRELSIIYAIKDSVYKIESLLNKENKTLYFFSIYNNNYKNPKFKNKPLNSDLKKQIITNIKQLYVFLNSQDRCSKTESFDKQDVINSKSIDCMIIITHKQKLLAEFYECILYEMLSKYNAI